MTKARKNYYKKIYESKAGEYSRVRDVYGKPSFYKERAEELIMTEMRGNGGYGYKVLTHNTQMFTCGYAYDDAAGNSTLVVHTPTERVEIEL